MFKSSAEFYMHFDWFSVMVYWKTDMGRRHHHQKHFVLFSYKTNLFHFALGLHNDRSQKEVKMYNASSSFLHVLMSSVIHY